MSGPFRLATFNLEHLDWSAGHPEAFARRCAALRPVLDALDADLLCLQEIDAQKRHKHGPRDYLALDYLLARVDAVIVTGGLGPTVDDITTAAVAKAFGLGLSSPPFCVCSRRSSAVRSHARLY